ncbi:hypothetical protein R3W88_020784 [Solanum pinnatisectum]|uniref:Prolamin-like domain-containing protein n=1 Tax=Solanum pinnatisectum TaxID=50273 RepID=A0AAV9KNB3_9SOLN|nr:hypothetical protein R3W88_020784 [Solanum pinnatisectum]
MATKPLMLFAFFSILCMTNSLVMARFDPIKLAPSPNDDGVVECWSSLKNINGCVKGVYKVFTGVGWLDSSCCEVVNKIDSKCWPKIFPFNPSFGFILMYYCSIVTAPAPAPLSAI